MSTVLVVALTLMVGACTSQKESAEKALQDVSAALTAAEAEASRQTPETLAAIRQRLGTLEAGQRSGDYKDVLAGVPILLTDIAQMRALGALVEAEKRLDAINADARRYAPDALQSLRARVEGLKGVLHAKDYEGLRAGVAAFSSELEALKSTIEAERKPAPLRALEASSFADPRYAGQCAAAFLTQARTRRENLAELASMPSVAAESRQEIKLIEGFAKTLEEHAEFASRSEDFVAARSELFEAQEDNAIRGPAGRNWYIENIINRTADCAEALQPLIGNGSVLEMTRAKPYLPIDDWYELVCKGGESISRLRRLEVDCRSVNSVRESIRAAQRYLVFKAGPQSLPVPEGCARAAGLVSTMEPVGWSLMLGNTAVKACTSGGIIPLAEAVLQQSVRK